MISWWQIIISGLVEGVTEFLPISSTGHLILLDAWLHFPITEFVKSFNIAIQLGAILAVVVLYFKKLLVRPKLGLQVIVAFIPTAFLGLALYRVIKTYLLASPTLVIWSLGLGGLGLLAVEWWLARRDLASKKSLEAMTYGQAVVLGLAQAVAMIPGVSRSAATIVGGLLLGFSRESIVEFSFFLAIPTMLAATGLDLWKTGFAFSAGEWGGLALGFLISFLVALVAVRWLLKYIQKHDFKIFAYYRLALALLAAILLFAY